MANPEYANFFPNVRKSHLPGGYMGKILRVDMTAEKLTDLNLPEDKLPPEVLARIAEMCAAHKSLTVPPQVGHRIGIPRSKG